MFTKKKVIFVLLSLTFVSMPEQGMARTWAQFGDKINPFHTKPKLLSQDPTLSQRTSRTLKRNLNPCYATNCKTVAGLTGCLITDPLYAKYESPDRFFFKTYATKKDPDGNVVTDDTAQTFITRPVKVVLYRVKVKVDTQEGEEPVSYEKPEPVTKVVNVVSPTAYKHFLNVARQNPNCMEVFCKHNCTKIDVIEPSLIDSQAFVIKEGAGDVWVDGKKYTRDTLSNMDDTEIRNLAQSFLLEKRNNMISLRCLEETDGGVKMRMFCNECSKSLDATLGTVNPTCQTFDATTNVASDIKAYELNAEYQAQLAKVQEEQDMNARDAALRAEADPSAPLDISQIANNTNTAFNGVKSLFS